MHVDGSCHCGKISFEGELDPEKVGICHCTDCQSLSGSAYVVYAQVPSAGFKLRGQPRHYVKTAESGNRRAQAFCPDCGSRLYACAETDPQVYNLRVGTLRQRAELKPRMQVWCRSAMPWAMTLDSVRKVEKNA